MQRVLARRVEQFRQWAGTGSTHMLVSLVLVFVACVILVLGAWGLFASSAPDTFRRSLAQLTLQLALIVVLGALVKSVFDSYAQLRVKEEQRQSKRVDLLRRLRGQHVKVAYAQRLILAHNSGKTYTEQLRSLMLVVPELEDISEDIEVAHHLFEQQNAGIVQGIKDIITYLNEGVEEYVRCHAFVDADAKKGSPLSTTIESNDMRWVRAFIGAMPDLPNDYDSAVRRSKGTMRSCVYKEDAV